MSATRSKCCVCHRRIPDGHPNGWCVACLLIWRRRNELDKGPARSFASEERIAELADRAERGLPLFTDRERR